MTTKPARQTRTAGRPTEPQSFLLQDDGSCPLTPENLTEIRSPLCERIYASSCLGRVLIRDIRCSPNSGKKQISPDVFKVPQAKSRTNRLCAKDALTVHSIR
jgi:hypothetical protein